tara:strand:+ start:2363 stop:2635 length:273 start_codon:yes stop_codon:yes gene_type:complete
MSSIAGMKYNMFRVSKKMLYNLEDYLNKMDPENTYNIGSAYGGWRLEIIDDKHCIKSVPVGNGFYHPKKEMYYLINAYIEGFEAAKKRKE